MANRNDNWGFDDREAGRAGRWEDERGYRSGRDERRAFEDRDDERREADARRYRARFDQDRVGYGRGQEYGLEAGGRRTESDRDYGRQDREQWRDSDRSTYGELRRTGPNAGVERYGQPSDYAYRPGEHELDPDYVSWRDEQMRTHDRDYADWRRAQHEQYDSDYRRYRTERRTNFGQTFQDWRSRNSMVGGTPDTGVAPGVSYAGERSSHSGGWTGGNTAGAGPKPSASLDPSLNMSGDPAMSQTGAGGRDAGGAQAASAASTGSEFGKEPPQVQAAAEGSTLRRDHDKPKDETK